MPRQTVKNPSNLQIVWDDGFVLVFSFAGAAADGAATYTCGIMHQRPQMQLQLTPPLIRLIPLQNIILRADQIYADPGTWIETIKYAARSNNSNIQIDYDDVAYFMYTSFVASDPPTFNLNLLYSLAG